MRAVKIERKTAETDISLRLDLDGRGESKIDLDCGFLEHMLTLFARHGHFDLDITCKGDTQVDYHHTAEDVGIVLGQAFRQALGDKKGIIRYGNMILPMDEALILSAVDLSGRGVLCCDLQLRARKVGGFDTELVEEFWTAFVREVGCALHIKQLAGKNTHHIIEGVYKSVGISLRNAVAIDKNFCDAVPSTKGVL